MPNIFDQFDDTPVTIQTKGADPKQPGAIRGQDLTNQGKAATLPFEAPQAGATLARTQQAVDDRPFERGDKLRADFDKRTQVQDYRTSVPLLISALKTQPNPQGDNALVYAYAKIMDPNSVVRESEADTAANTAGYLDAAIEKVKKNAGWDDARGLPPGAAAGLRREMNTKVAQYAKAYGVARRDFQDMAIRQKVNPDDVVGRSPADGFKDEYKRLSQQQGWTDKEAPAVDNGPSEVDPTGGNPLLSPGDRDYLSRNAREKGPEWVRQYLADRNLKLPESELSAAVDYWSKGGQQDPVVNAPQGEGNLAGAALATPVGTGAANYLNAAAFGVPQLLAGDKGFDALRERNPGSAMTGDILGGITGTAGGAFGLMKAGASIPRAATGANLLYGTAFGANTNEENRLGGAAVGGGSALVGEGIGRYVAAPAIDALARTKPVQSALGMFGRSTPRRLSGPESELVGEVTPNLDQIRTNLSDASRLNLPFSLADASPAARSTLGAATRLDPGIAESVSKQLAERGLGRNERAATALSGLAEPVDMRATTDGIFKSAQEAASPFYERAYAQPAIATPEIEGLLQRPSLRSAMGKAQGTIAEQGGSPTTMGFALDAAGDPVLNRLPTGQLSELGAAHTALSEAQDALARGNASLAGNVDRRGLQGAVDAAQARLEAAQAGMAAAPSTGSLAEVPAYNWRALDYTKRGLDDVLEEMRNPITRKLPSDYKTRAVQDSRVLYRNALGNLNDDYRQGLGVYSDIAKRSDDLNSGYQGAARGMTDRDFFRSLDNVIPENMEYFQRGYTTNLSDNINRSSDGTNAYNLVAGTPGQRNRLTTLFPEGGADFLRQRELEGLMSQTGQEVLGGSASAGRLAANERFAAPGLGDLAEVGLSAATGVPPVGALSRGGANAVRGMFANRGKAMTQSAARDLAPTLANPNPAQAGQSLDTLLADMERLKKYQEALRAGSSIATAPAFAGLGANYF